LLNGGGVPEQPSMAFSSIEFLWFFMPLVLALYLALPPWLRNGLLAVVSLVFYVWGAHALLLLFLVSIAVNYIAGLLISGARDREDHERSRRIMWAAVGANLVALLFWKYTVFAVTQLSSFSGAVGGGDLTAPSIALPLGISFFTFHGISYVVDVYRGTSRPMRRVADYAQYIAFFPQLIAGPIVRYHEIDEQIRHPPPRNQRMWDIAEGFPRFALGLSKKVVVADPLGAVVAAAFDGGGSPSFAVAWIGALAFTVQIYFDFSGYSDMAIGLARMFGLRFPENFRRPYSAVSLTDFWRRWHMTLSRWFRDYVYIPLGGSRGSQQETVRNLMVVFFLTGIWHGAAWTFLFWGLFHGAVLVVERLFGLAAMPPARLQAARRAATFLLVVAGWVLFRATGIGQAADFLVAMVPHPGISLDLPATMTDALSPQAKIALVAGLATVLLPGDLVAGRLVQGSWTGARLVARGVALAALPYTAIVIAAGSFSPFLYFRF
jgi:alginate O-acetyltransferase complex protein AlgI